VDLNNGLRVALHEFKGGTWGLIDRVSFYKVVRRGADGRERGGRTKSTTRCPRRRGGPACRLRYGRGRHVVSASDGVGQLPRTAASPAALVDEEWWLLSAVARSGPGATRPRSSQRSRRRWGAASTVRAGSTSRTQLWKPSRSWWEANQEREEPVGRAGRAHQPVEVSPLFGCH